MKGTMRRSWQSWSSSLVSSAAFEFISLCLATILTNRDLDVFAEQPGIFFASVVWWLCSGVCGWPVFLPCSHTSLASSSFPARSLGNAEVKTSAIP